MCVSSCPSVCLFAFPLHCCLIYFCRHFIYISRAEQCIEKTKRRFWDIMFPSLHYYDTLTQWSAYSQSFLSLTLYLYLFFSPSLFPVSMSFSLIRSHLSTPTHVLPRCHTQKVVPIDHFFSFLVNHFYDTGDPMFPVYASYHTAHNDGTGTQPVWPTVIEVHQHLLMPHNISARF